MREIPEDLTRHIFRYMDAKTLIKAREVCILWNSIAIEDDLWRAQCIKVMHSLASDIFLWPLITLPSMQQNEFRWRRLYPLVTALPQWGSALAKPGRVFCRIRAFQLLGDPLSNWRLPPRLTVSRRFPVAHLPLWILPDAAVLYLEPTRESDQAGFDELIEYLSSRERAGLALQGEHRFIVIPPGEYAATNFGYSGKNLLCVVQEAYPAVIMT